MNLRVKNVNYFFDNDCYDPIFVQVSHDNSDDDGDDDDSDDDIAKNNNKLYAQLQITTGNVQRLPNSVHATEHVTVQALFLCEIMSRKFYLRLKLFLVL
jgi:hypothetical protein